ncbi:MAG: carboxylating nicotinate-nucleotide diphosphorylase, partial [Gammaproteobacteria bacterium]
MTTANLPPLPADLDDCVRRALAEDVGDGDLTASLIPADAAAHAEVVCRERAVLAGSAWFDRVFALLDAAVVVRWARGDGEHVAPGDPVCTLRGPARAIVTGERTALNFLQTLSGTAITTRAHVDALGDSHTRILDTRKTVPGLRAAQKYAVRCGGGSNHRMGLYDAVLIKENHIAAAGSIMQAVAAIRAAHPRVKVEVEVESLDELEQALTAGVDMVLLDNFSIADMRHATAHVAGRAQVEISGGVALDELAALADVGADY